eukprot:TRINITY_DN2758_c0_g1_i4.p1 TRINITY_DN2758_c0_g1~~TRINITY_DN2758_c0_g1_i4.p1  ORF type:complete len:805 (-),score=130.43 TRINITY_DN2758_c0_g1_i4:119-2533(-)
MAEDITEVTTVVEMDGTDITHEETIVGAGPPSPVSGNLSQEEFDLWREDLLKQLQENVDHQLFIPGGLYEEWSALKDSKAGGRRIRKLHPSDPARIRLEKRIKRRNYSQEEKEYLFDELLSGRNCQLNEFIHQLCNHINNDHESAIKSDCTSFNSYIDCILNPHLHQPVNSDIFDVADHVISSSEDYNAFYIRFRDAVCRNLKGCGMKMKYLNNEELAQDEILSPTFEELIILWCLEKINVKLPQLTSQTFSQKMNEDNLTLKDLQPEIFDKIPDLLGSLPVGTSIYENAGIEIQNSDDAEFRVYLKGEDDMKQEHAALKVKTENMDGVSELGAKARTTSKLEQLLTADFIQEDDDRLDYDEIDHDYVPPTSKQDKKLPTLKKRLSDQENGEKSMCEFCEKSFKTKKALREHISRRHKLTFACSQCDQVLQGQLRYEKHLKEFHRDYYIDYYDQRMSNKGAFSCRYCGEPQESQTKLRAHMLQHKQQNNLDFVQAHERKSPTKTSRTPKPLASKKSQEQEEKKDGGSTAEPKENICDICGKSVGFKYMEQHKKIHSTENLDCTICDISFQNRKAYLKHKRSHRSIEKTFSCEHCGMTFGRTSHLKTHMKIHIVGEKLKCLTCKRTFFDKKEMGSHVCKHHGCDICGEKFLRARNLEFHRRMHFGEAVFSCSQCESLFLTKKRLTEHVNHQHKKEKKYVCEICDKRFLMKSGLTAHTLTHTGEKPFKCNLCDLRFTQKGNLETHAKQHTDEMPHVCSVCNAKFRQAGELKRHREFRKCGFSQQDFYSESDNSVIKMLQPSGNVIV